jgi:hypothetical protein
VNNSYTTQPDVHFFLIHTHTRIFLNKTVKLMMIMIVIKLEHSEIVVVFRYYFDDVWSYIPFSTPSELMILFK